MVPVVAGFIGMAFGMLVAISFVGWWLRRLLCRGDEGFNDVPVGLFGVVVVQVLAWYCSTTLNTGLGRLWPWLVAAVVIAAVVLIVSDARRGAISLKSFWGASRVQVLTAAGSLALFAINADELLARGMLTVSSDNNDVAQYATVAKHLDLRGTGIHGWISGIDLGRTGREDVHGALSFISFLHWIVGGPYYRVMLAVLAVACALLSQACAYLISRLTSLSVPCIVLLGLVPQSCFLVIYVARQYFLSQILAMALIIVVFAIMMVEPGSLSLRGSWRRIVVIGLAFSSLLLTYPHMALLAPPLLFGVVALHHWTRIRATIRVGIIVSVGFMLGCLLIPTRVVIAADKLRELSTVTAGYVLDGLTPWGLAGFQSSFKRTISAATILSSIVLLAVSLFAALRVRRRRVPGWRLPAVWLWVACLASYALFYFARGGATYQQWKWVSFFDPLIVLAIFAPLFQLLSDSWGRSRGAVAVALLGLLVVLNSNAEKTIAPINLSNNWVSPDLADIGRDHAFDDVRSVNVQLYPYWETMWAAEELGPKEVYTTSMTYWTTSAAEADWTLVRADSVPADQAPTDLRYVNSSFVLVHRPSGPTSAQLPLTSTIEISPAATTVPSGADFTGTLRVTNTGTSTWLSSGPDAGAVNVGVREVDGNGIVVAELERIPLRVFPFTTPPGATIDVPFSIPALGPGEHHLEFEAVSEMVGWFASAADGGVPTVSVTVT